MVDRRGIDAPGRSSCQNRPLPGTLDPYPGSPIVRLSGMIIDVPKINPTRAQLITAFEVRPLRPGVCGVLASVDLGVVVAPHLNLIAAWAGR